MLSELDELCDQNKNISERWAWFERNNIPLFGVQTHPTQDTWTTSPKCHADICIDDRNLGTPLVQYDGFRPCVLWSDAKYRSSSGAMCKQKGVVTMALQQEVLQIAH